jgi:monoamine oxidase
MTAALELRKAGYKVQVLEFNRRPGGRNWTIRGGDSFTELGGQTQNCEFEQGLYLNPGPWRIPYHHRAVLDYCKRLNVALEPFVQLNHNALLHGTGAFGGQPQRIRDIKTDFQGHVSELLAKATQQGKLDEVVSVEDKEILLQAMKSWGALDKNYAYKASLISADFRGYAKDPGGGLGAAPVAGEPIAMSDILRSRMWRYLQNFALHEFQTTMFQPVGGMDMIGKAFAREVGDLIRYDAKVTRIQQDGGGVSVSFIDAKAPGTPQVAKADWCVCTIPLSILSQIQIDVGAPMKAAIDAVPYASAVKVGLQFKRRFWEEDEAIYGGITYTDLPIRQIAYPNSGFNRSGRGVLLGAYIFEGANAFEFTSMPPADRVKRAVAFGSRIHPQYGSEFENGVAVAWHRVPFTLGCAGNWTEKAREEHYDDLCQIDGRIVLAGEHASYIPAWQEGAILSSLDAITRLHDRVVRT